MQIEFLGATHEVTGSCYLLQVGDINLLVECGLIQGSSRHESHNRDPFPCDVKDIVAVVLTHAHLDHSGRWPLLIKRGFSGPIYTHKATVDLCAIMLQDSMKINQIETGAIIIAGSGMCTGGRIKHHLKHNIWRQKTHVMIVGFQARGTLGRAIVDGARYIRLWGEVIKVKARVHTVGGLSAHADQQGLINWYGHFKNRPRIVLVHGEPKAMDALASRLKSEYATDVLQANFKQKLTL